MLRLRQFTFVYQRNILRSMSTESGKNENSNLPPIETHPIKRTLKLFQRDGKTIKKFFKTTFTRTNSNNESEPMQHINLKKNEHSNYTGDFQSHCDILVIGGGALGSSVAYWLKRKAREGLNVVVVERDPTYKQASTVLSVGGLRQQFSLPENIQMSLFGAEFIRNAKEYLGDVDLSFMPYGYLTLATEKSAETLKRNSKMQNDLGARNELLTASQLKTKFPWLNTDDIALGCHGLEKEGWFDPWALLMGLKNGARANGAHYVDGEVVNFKFNTDSDVVIRGNEHSSESYVGLDQAVVKLSNGETRNIKFAICILAGGANSGQIARLARIGTGPGLLRVPLPVEPRKRYVYVINTQGTNAPGLCTPLTIDPNGTYFRRDGLCGNYICGRSPSEGAEPATDNLDVDHEFFETDVWPTLSNRVKAFESLKVCGSWAGFYEYNLFDENGIIGPHPYYINLYIATGFSGHGIQQAPAVGRSIAELIIDGQFRTIDLSRLSFDRILVDQPMYETNIF